MVATAMVLLIVTGLVSLWRSGALGLMWQAVNGSQVIK